MKIKYISVIISVVLFLCGCGTTENTTVELDDTDLLEAGPVVVEEESFSQDNTGTIMVFVCGEVKNPGVYEMNRDDRVCDAILRAGDFTDKADTDYLNQAAGLTDGEKLYIPNEEEVETNDISVADDDSGLININTATAAELKTLPGIGDVKAEAIVAYRNNHGNFGSVDDIKKVDGIKSGLYDSIKDMITVN